MKTYMCANCRETFSKTDESEERANAEARHLWGAEKASTDPTYAEVCDDCWKKIHAWLIDGGLFQMRSER